MLVQRMRLDARRGTFFFVFFGRRHIGLPPAPSPARVPKVNEQPSNPADSATRRQIFGLVLINHLFRGGSKHTGLGLRPPIPQQWRHFRSYLMRLSTKLHIDSRFVGGHGLEERILIRTASASFGKCIELADPSGWHISKTT